MHFSPNVWIFPSFIFSLPRGSSFLSSPGYTHILLALKNSLQAGYLWCTPLIPAVRGQRRVDLCVFKVSLVYRMNFKTVGTVTQRNPVSKKKILCNTNLLIMNLPNFFQHLNYISISFGLSISNVKPAAILWIYFYYWLRISRSLLSIFLLSLYSRCGDVDFWWKTFGILAK